MWVEAKPEDGRQILAGFRFKVSGYALYPPAKASRGREEQDLFKVVENGSYRIDLIVPDHIASEQNTDIIFRVADSKGTPIVDLEPLMAAEGYCIIITSDAKEFLHVLSWRGGPDVTFSVTFPRQGAYTRYGANFSTRAR